MIIPQPGTDTHLELEFKLHEVPYVASILFQFFGHIKVWLLEGDLGAGKTTLIKGLEKPLYMGDKVNSPSYGLINEYESSTLGKVYHADLYRLKSLEQAIEIGLFEIVDSGYFCLIEWASAIQFQPDVPHIRIQLEHLNETSRKLTATLHEN